MASRRGRPRTAAPKDNDKTVQRGVGLSLRNLEKQTRTKIVDQNAKSKEQRARKKETRERQRHDAEMRAMAKFRNSAVEIAVFDDDVYDINDFPTCLNPHTEYEFVDQPTRQPLVEFQNQPQEAPPISTSPDSNVLLQVSNDDDVRDDQGNMADVDQNHQMDRTRRDSNREEHDDQRNEDLQEDDDANSAHQQMSNGWVENGDLDDEPVVVVDEIGYGDPGREELAYYSNWEDREFQNDNWKSAGIEEDDLLPDLIIPGEGPDLYDVVRLRERFFRFGKDYDDDDDDDEYTNSQPVKVDGFIVNVTEDYDSGKCLEPSPSDDHHVLWPVTEIQAQNELYQILKASDINAYFDYIARKFVKPRSKSGACRSSCGCHGPWLHRGTNVNPLHIAVIVSTVQFVECILLERVVYEQLVGRLGENDNTIAIYEHYMSTLFNWFIQASTKGGVTPMDSAAELGRIDVLHVLMNSKLGEETLKFRASVYGKRVSPKSYQTYQHRSEEGILTCLVDNDKWKELSENDKGLIWKNTSEAEKRQAAIVAASNGNEEFIGFLKVMSGGGDVLTGNIAERDCFAGRVDGEGIECYPPPPAHLVAQYGHFEMFDKMTDEEKRCKDVYNFTALSCMFEFTDEQILSQLKMFRNVKREDALVFVSQIIVKQRFGLLKVVLDMVLSNADYFTVQFANHPVYEDYGLPSYVALPLETALSRCDSFDMFNIVLQAYFKFIKQPLTKPMITEDAYRCLESIQDKAYRISDQLRLAVILMVMPFVNSSTDRFEYIIKVHENGKSRDLVAEYVMEKVRKSRGTFGNCGGTMILWKKALLSARDAMLLKNGSLEDVDCAPSLATKSEKLRQMGQLEPTRSILKKSPRRIDEPIDGKTSFMEAMQRLVTAFERFDMEEENAGGNHSGLVH